MHPSEYWWEMFKIQQSYSVVPIPDIDKTDMFVRDDILVLSTKFISKLSEITPETVSMLSNTKSVQIELTVYDSEHVDSIYFSLKTLFPCLEKLHIDMNVDE